MSIKTTEFTCNHCGILKSCLFHWAKNICKACCHLYTPCGKCKKLVFWKLIHTSNNKNKANLYQCLNCLKEEHRRENKKRKT